MKQTLYSIYFHLNRRKIRLIKREAWMTEIQILISYLRERQVTTIIKRAAFQWSIMIILYLKAVMVNSYLFINTFRAKKILKTL